MVRYLYLSLYHFQHISHTQCFFFRKDGDPSIKWNEKTEVNRKSHQGNYEIVDNVARYTPLPVTVSYIIEKNSPYPN